MSSSIFQNNEKSKREKIVGTSLTFRNIFFAGKMVIFEAGYHVKLLGCYGNMVIFEPRNRSPARDRPI